MNNSLYIYQYSDIDHFKGPSSITVVFVHQQTLPSQEYLADEIKYFFEQHTISDYVVVLLPNYLSREAKVWFHEGKADTFKRLPGRSDLYFAQHYFVYTYDAKSRVKPAPVHITPSHESFFKNLYRHGNTDIFIKNGGLVESSADHHFVFPSKKHCSKFIRTGNVLINSAEIFFIAVQLLPSFSDKQTIYCDTSSINVLPFAVFELKRRFGETFEFPNVESFKSYDVFESRKTPFSSNDLILISSSTSGNIIDRLFNDHLAQKDQIKLIFYLGPLSRYRENEKNIICNLTRNSLKFPFGVEEFETYPNESACQLCKNFSHPVLIHGDVFLTVKPKVEKILLTVTSKHVPKFLNEFVEDYRVDKRVHPGEAVIRAFYKETKGDPGANYETYIDTSKIYEKPKFKEKLNRLINKYIPANTRYLIHLPDESSKILAKIIRERSDWKEPPALLKLDDLLTGQLENIEGCAVIVASCIVTGKNLLSVSRLMRNFDNLSIIYFIGVLGTSNEDYQSSLKNNLSRGRDKSDERPFIAVETIYCSLDKYNTIWQKEKEFLEDMVLPELDEENVLHPFLKARVELLRDNKQTIGLTDEVFMRTHKNQSLYLRKNFAFWGFQYTEDQVSQSEVYFSINSIINYLENKPITSDCTLQQSTYVRNILSTENFYRFNDGIIQACLLRAAKPEYLAYDLDDDSSVQMKALVESMIDKYDAEHGEAVMEFLLAIGMKTLRLKRMDTTIILSKAEACADQLISQFATVLATVLKTESII